MTLQRDTDGDGVATLTLDDGERNALDVAAVGSLADELEDVRAAPAVVLRGRGGVLTAGLDLAVVRDGDRDELHRLLVDFGRMLMALWTLPTPTVCAATGHAVAAGSLLSLACDHSVAARGDFRWGLTETQVGLPMPRFALEVAARSLAADRRDDLILPGRMLDPAGAVEAGLADELAPPDEVSARARGHAAQLAGLPAAAYAETKRRLRGGAAERVRAGIEDDVTAVLDARGAP